MSELSHLRFENLVNVSEVVLLEVTLSLVYNVLVFFIFLMFLAVAFLVVRKFMYLAVLLLQYYLFQLPCHIQESTGMGLIFIKADSGLS